MKRIMLNFIIVFVSFSTMIFALDDGIKVPSSLYKVDDFYRNIEMYHTERGVSTLTSVWGYIIFTNVYYRNNPKTCWLVFDLNSDTNDSRTVFNSVMFYGQDESDRVVLNINLATDRERVFTDSDTTIHLRKLNHIIRRQHRLSDNEINSLIKLIEDNKFEINVRFVDRNNYYHLNKKDFNKGQARNLYDLLKFYRDIKEK